MRKILSFVAAFLFAASMMADPVVLPAVLDVSNVSFRSEGMPDFVIPEGEDYAGTYFDMGAHDSSNDTLLYAEWDVTIQPIKYNLAVDVYNTNSWRVQLYLLNQAGDTVKDLRYKGSSSQKGQFSIGSLDLRDLAAGNYKLRARAATAWSAMKLKDIIFAADYQGVSVALPDTLLPAYALLSNGASVTNNAIAFAPSTANTEYATWNVSFAAAGTFNVTIDITASNGHNYGVALLSADGQTEIGAVNEGGQKGDTGIKTLGTIAVPAAGNYVVKLTNAIQWSEAVLNNIVFAVAVPEFYLVGSMNGWAPAEAYKFAVNPANDTEYMLNATLAVGDSIKVMKVLGNTQTWYPDGMDNHYTVDAAHAGEKDIYFQEAYKADWAAFGGYFYIEANPAPQPIVEYDTIYTWYGKRGETAATEAIERGGVATAEGGNSNIVVGTAQKTNWTIKMNKGFSNTNYVGIALNSAVKAGDIIQCDVFKTGTSDAVFGMDFSADKASASTTSQILYPQGTDTIQIITTNVAPEDVLFTVPASAAGAKYIRIYRNSGSTGLYVANLTILRVKGDTPEPEPEVNYLLKNNWNGGEWTWKEMTKDGDTYKLDSVVFGGTGVNYKSDLLGAPELWVPMADFLGDKVDAKDTVTFVLNPADSTITAKLLGKYVEPEPEPEYAVVYNWSNGSTLQVGTQAYGTSVEASTVKIHKNELDINAIKFSNSYVYADGKYLTIKPAEGGFKAGDVLNVAVLFSNADTLTKFAQADVYAADGATRLFLSDSATTVNGRVSMADPVVQTYTLEADQDSLLLGRYGNTAMFISQLFVVREVVPEPEHTYTVAGDQKAFGSNWNPADAANDMAKQEDGTYKWEKTDLTLAAGKVTFKVVEDHAWTHAWPASDYELAIPAAGIYTITITFNPAAEADQVVAEATKTGEAVVIPVVQLHGTFTNPNWATTDAFALAEDSLSASLKLNLEAKSYEFGMKFDGTWKANGATLTRENPSTSLAEGSGNMHMTADQAGEYIFTYTFATQTLEVAYPKIIKHYGVAEAIAAAADSVLVKDDLVYIRGIVTKIEFKGKNFANYGSACIYVADAAGAADTLEFYNCYSMNADTFKTSDPAYDATSTAWAQFNSVSDANGNTVALGDVVEAFGKYNLYNGVHQLNQGCYITEIHKPLTIPTNAPAAPTAAEADVMAIYCNHYTTNNLNFAISGWAGAYQTLDIDSTMIGYWAGMTWECIIDPAPNTDNAHDFSAYKKFHVDLWAPKAAKIKITVEAVAGGNYKEGVKVDLVQGWNSFDFNVAEWPGNYDFKNVKCFVFEQYQTPAEESFEGNPFAFANLYFYDKESQGLDNTADGVKAVKYIQNGMLLIEKNGKVYTITGLQVK